MSQSRYIRFADKLVVIPLNHFAVCDRILLPLVVVKIGLFEMCSRQKFWMRSVQN